MNNEGKWREERSLGFTSCGYYAQIVRQDWRKCGHVGEFMWCEDCPEIERAEGERNGKGEVRGVR